MALKKLVGSLVYQNIWLSINLLAGKTKSGLASGHPSLLPIPLYGSSEIDGCADAAMQYETILSWPDKLTTISFCIPTVVGFADDFP
jgi:hypothetical protein